MKVFYSILFLFGNIAFLYFLCYTFFVKKV